jgi:hypothetical protein
LKKLPKKHADNQLTQDVCGSAVAYVHGRRERGIITHVVSGDYNKSTYKELQQPLNRQGQIKINPTIHALSR